MIEAVPMPSVKAQAVNIAIDATQSVSGLLQMPRNAHACYVFAHGAGAGMTHPFMAAVADGLAERDIATLRYQFAYMERGSKRPDSPALAHAAVRAAVAVAVQRVEGVPCFAGGKSFGGRMTSQAQAAQPMPGVHGLAFLGFPLHAPGKPSDERGAHLSDVKVPMLFLQGTRDEFAQLDLLTAVTKKLGKRATLVLFDDADHSFHVPARSGRKDVDVRTEVLDAMSTWMTRVISSGVKQK
jgi:predicted alpha/beta-hydrolase family hydrolase